MMDETVKIFKEYFRDIYSANPATCAGLCDSITPPSLGPAAYELRRCCKAGCSDENVLSQQQCQKEFCPGKCMEQVLVNNTEEILIQCIAICSRGCSRRFG